MGKHNELDHTLGPYWNDPNTSTPRASRSTTKSTVKYRDKGFSAHDALQSSSVVFVPAETPTPNRSALQPDWLSLTSNSPSRERNNPELRFNTNKGEVASASLQFSASSDGGGELNFASVALHFEGSANQTSNRHLEVDDGVSHGSTVRQVAPRSSLEKQNFAHKSNFESDPSINNNISDSSSISSNQISRTITGISGRVKREDTRKATTADHGMSSRPGAGRRAGRDTGKDNDVEAELFNRVLDAVRKAKEYNDESQRLGTEILALEEEIKSKGRSTTEQHRKLDDLYRQKLRNAEAEKKVHDEEDIVNNLAILATMRSTDDTPAPRSGHHNAKSSRAKGGARTALDNEAIADSPGPIPSDSRVDVLKRGKDRGGSGTPQRSSSVASQHRSGTALAKEEVASSTSTTASATGDTSSTQHKGILAERAGTLIPGVEVFYKFPKGSPDDLGVGIQCIIKKVWADKKPSIIYDVQDPEPDPSGKINVHKATAKDLYPIPSTSETRHLPSFGIGATVYARYPDTDTFYKAKVVRPVSSGKGDSEKGKGAGEYILRFEGEEDDKEQPVERRFVLDAKMRWSA